ncbi:MAG: glycoside hydrolase family 3 protein, partial [Candidatus Heimdallarchaeota archaeon]|nr:glycoside hydrolase family 3 protein [Candidatus Heimdallarchaeota archaeon]
AEITALEIRASGIPWNFNPVLGVARNPLWSRLWETFGESPYLVSIMGQAYINGMEGHDNASKGRRVAACMKHYLGYSNPHNGRDRAPAWIPERMLRDIYLPPFALAVETGVQSVMVNSSEINGLPVHTDYNILTKILKDELGFKGFTVSDWSDVQNLYTRDQVARTQKEAVQMSVMAGLDMSMVPFDYSFYELLLELVNEGEVPVSRIDDAVSRILRVKFNTGLFENPYPDATLVSEFASEQSTAINLQSAQEAITLLKNTNNILPLSKDLNILVTGPTANMLSIMNGGWTITWQGNDESVYPAEKLTVLEAIQQKIGKENVTYFEGVDFEKKLNFNDA